MVDNADDLRPEWLEGKRRVGLTAGASAPEVLVNAVIERLRALGAVSVRTVAGKPERVHFPLPLGLGDKAMREVPN
jgi:4-hydroxy-3-methylbut-2-enyl diphosphate reductase